MSDLLKKRIVMGSVIAVVLFVIIVVCATAFSSYQSCDPVETDPLSGDSKQKAALVESSDKSTLVSLLGSLKYDVEDKKVLEIYVPLTAHKVTATKGEDGKTTSEVQVDAHCSLLTFSIKTTSSGFEVSSIAVELVKENKSIGSCAIERPGITYSQGAYYSCQELRAYKCQGKTSAGELVLVATLNVADLKLETDRDPKLAKDGKFSKDEYQCEDKPT